MKTSEIRPEQAQKQYKRMFQQELDRFLDEQGRLRPEFCTPCDCPVCVSSVKTPYDPPSPYQTCNECGCVYTDPRLRDDLIEDLARNSPAIQFFHEHILLATGATRREKVFGHSLQLLREPVPSGRILELGSAVGTFLGMLDEAGYQAEGIELCRFSVEYTHSKGYTVHDRPIEALGLPAGSYDAVCAWKVFGHLSRLQETVAGIFDALKPGGMLAWTGTNINSFEYLTLKTRIMNPLLRYVYYTPDCTQRLLTKAGFVDIAITTPGETDVQTVRETLGQPDPSLGHYANHILFDESPGSDERRESFQRWLAKNNQSGYMLVTSRKPG